MVRPTINTERTNQRDGAPTINTEKNELGSHTSDDLPAVRLGLQEGVEQLGLVGTVHTGLDGVLQDLVDRPRPKVVRQLQHQLTVQVRPAVTVLVHVHTNWGETTRKDWITPLSY